VPWALRDRPSALYPDGRRASTFQAARSRRLRYGRRQCPFIVEDVDAAIAFYCRHLGFEEQMHPAATFAMLTRGDLRLVLSATGGGPGGGQATTDGRVPQPEGWNRPRARTRCATTCSCGIAAPPVLQLDEFLRLLNASSWDSYVILSPMAATRVDVDMLAAVSGHPVRVAAHAE
jgi:hypothetical protein